MANQMDTSAHHHGPTALDYLTRTEASNIGNIWRETAIPFEMKLTPLFAGKLVMDAFNRDIHAAWLSRGAPAAIEGARERSHRLMSGSRLVRLSSGERGTRQYR